MSRGARIPLELAREAAAALRARWGLEGPECNVVGSIRRGNVAVRDIELMAPAAANRRDELYWRILPTISAGGMLFGAGASLGRALVGFKPGFLGARLEVDLAELLGEAGLPRVGVNLFRYRPGNRGWTELLRTGPDLFGCWFLLAWKERWGIAAGSPASVKGYLVDGGGARVECLTEEECFERCGIPFIEPERRSDVVQRALSQRPRLAEVVHEGRA